MYLILYQHLEHVRIKIEFNLKTIAIRSKVLSQKYSKERLVSTIYFKVFMLSTSIGKISAFQVAGTNTDAMLARSQFQVITHLSRNLLPLPSTCM